MLDSLHHKLQGILHSLVKSESELVNFPMTSSIKPEANLELDHQVLQNLLTNLRHLSLAREILA